MRKRFEVVNNAFSQHNLSDSYLFELFEQTLVSSHDTESVSATISKAIAYDHQLRYLQDLSFCSNTPEIIGDKVNVISCLGFFVFSTKVDFNPHPGVFVLKMDELFKRSEANKLFLKTIQKLKDDLAARKGTSGPKK